MAEFALVLIPLVVLMLCVVQVAAYLYARNIMTASAAEGARFAANADVPYSAGGTRAEQVAGAALPSRALATIACEARQEFSDGGLVLVAVQCRGSVPTLITVLGDVLPMDVTGRAVAEGA